MKKLLCLVTITIFSISLNAKSVEEIFERCANCHGDKAEESALGKSKIISELSEEEIIIALKEYKEGTKNESGLGSLMESQVYALEEEDMKNLAKYIKTLK